MLRVFPIFIPDCEATSFVPIWRLMTELLSGQAWSTWRTEWGNDYEVNTWTRFWYYWPRCGDNSPVTDGFPSQRVSNADLWWFLCGLNNLLSKQSTCRRSCNVTVMVDFFNELTSMLTENPHHGPERQGGVSLYLARSPKEFSWGVNSWIVG